MIKNGMKLTRPNGSIVVVKVGSDSITKQAEDGTLMVDPIRVRDIANGIQKLRNQNYRVILVTSGAVAAGMHQEHFKKRPGIHEATRLSSLAAIGQSELMAMYMREFQKRGIVIAQGLPTRNDFDRDNVTSHMKATLKDLLHLGVLPILNENDFTSYSEMRFGDNDLIAGLVAVLTKAKHVVLLTNQIGIMSANPDRDPEAMLIQEVGDPTPEMFDDSQEKSAAGSGGINSKIICGDMLRYAGAETAVTHVDNAKKLDEVISGEIECSRFRVEKSYHMPIEVAFDIVQTATSRADHPFFRVRDHLNLLKLLSL